MFTYPSEVRAGQQNEVSFYVHFSGPWRPSFVWTDLEDSNRRMTSTLRIDDSVAVSTLKFTAREFGEFHRYKIVASVANLNTEELVNGQDDKKPSRTLTLHSPKIRVNKARSPGYNSE